MNMVHISESSKNKLPKNPAQRGDTKSENMYRDGTNDVSDSPVSCDRITQPLSLLLAEKNIYNRHTYQMHAIYPVEALVARGTRRLDAVLLPRFIEGPTVELV
jgi:hypothetical protein